MPTKGHSKTRLTWRLRIGHRHQISSRSPSGCRYFDLMAEPVHKVYQMFGGDEEAMDNAAMKYLPQARRGRTFQNRRFGWKNSCAERTGTGSAPVLRHPNHSSPLSICLKSVPERSKNTLAAVIQSSTMSIVEGGTLILAMKMRLVMRTPKANLLPPKHLPHCNPYCQAELQGWYCHECTDNPHVRGSLDEYGDLVHDGEHKFCLHCTPADVWSLGNAQLTYSEIK